MARLGVVVDVTDREAGILTSRRGICEGCSEQASCSFEDSLGEEKSDIVTAINHIQAKPGDYVEFDLAGRAELKLSLIVWVAPLIGLLAGAFIGSDVYNHFSVSQDIGVLFGAISGFLAVFLLVILFDRRSSNKEEFTPLILKVVKRPNSENPQKDIPA